MSTPLPSSLPSPKLPGAHAVPSLRWGIVGPGLIANAWVETVLRNTGQRVSAVASRTPHRAKDFAAKFGIAAVYTGYEGLFGDPNIDAVYVATQQHAHRDTVLAAIAAGKHVLVEKPITTLPADARAIEAAARAAGVLVMEAMWTSYLPQASIIRQLIADGVLGDIRYVQADLGQDQWDNPRLFEPEGGGTSHDMGIYPVAFISQFFPGERPSVRAMGELTDFGVDSEIAIRLKYPSGAIGHAYASMLAFSRSAAWVDGSRASLSVELPFPVPSTLNLFHREFNPRLAASWTDTSGIVGHEGLCYQATAFASYVEQELTDSPIRSLADSVRDIELITEARHQICAYYPGEVRPASTVMPGVI